jgi:hypothetical protein
VPGLVRLMLFFDKVRMFEGMGFLESLSQDRID